MKRALASALAAASIIASAPLFAQQANSQPSVVQAGDYALDSAHTLVRFTVDHFGISEFFGTFPGATGTLSIDPTDIASAKLDVSVPVETVSTTNATLDEELVGEELHPLLGHPRHNGPDGAHVEAHAPLPRSPAEAE